MNSHSYRKYVLSFRLGCSRLGWVALSMLIVGSLSGLCWLWWIPTQISANEKQAAWIKKQRLMLSVAPRTASVPRISPTQKSLNDFYSVLGDRRRTETHLHILFDLAQTSGITLSKGDYKSEYDPVSKVHAYQIQLPVTGTYSAILNFCEKVLRAMPFASLDELNVKRDRIGSPVLSVQLRFTLFLQASSAPQPQRLMVAMEGTIP